MKIIERVKSFNWKPALPWLALAVVAFFLVKGLIEEPETEYIYRDVTVEVPVVEHVFDTIIKPVAVVRTKVEIDSTYYEEYKKLKDSVEKDSMFKEAIKINEYNTKFEDSIQTIKVYSKTRGELLEQSAEYKTKKRSITIKDSVAIHKRFKVHVGVQAGLPLIPSLSTAPVGQLNLYITPKGSDNPFTVGFDTEGRILAGKIWKISLRKKNKKN